jgi:hypothetical protein
MHTKISKDKYDFNESEWRVVKLFMDQSIQLELRKLIKVNDNNEGLKLIFRSIYALGSGLKKVQSDQQANAYADKLIRYGRSLVPDEALTNPECIAAAALVTKFRNP